MKKSSKKYMTTSSVTLHTCGKDKTLHLPSTLSTIPFSTSIFKDSLLSEDGASFLLLETPGKQRLRWSKGLCITMDSEICIVVSHQRKGRDSFTVSNKLIRGGSLYGAPILSMTVVSLLLMSLVELVKKTWQLCQMYGAPELPKSLVLLQLKQLLGQEPSTSVTPEMVDNLTQRLTELMSSNYSAKQKDVRRLDLAMSVASGDIDAALINKDITKIKEVPHVYTSDACKTRYGRGRRPEDVEFTQEAVEAILVKATEMGNKYTSKIPIVEAADQRIKIARLAVAAACCVVSSEDLNTVIVKPEHVNFVVDFMDRIYSAKSLGYDKLSEQELSSSDQSDDSLAKLRVQFLALPSMDINEMATILYQLPYFSRAALEDYTGLARDDLKQLLKFMTTNYLVDRVRGDYRRLPLGTAFLENMVENPAALTEIKEARKAAYGDEY